MATYFFARVTYNPYNELEKGFTQNSIPNPSCHPTRNG
nr:MAG TPA: hypothetical protein [Caudoviricetes sp.]